MNKLDMEVLESMKYVINKMLPYSACHYVNDNNDILAFYNFSEIAFFSQLILHSNGKFFQGVIPKSLKLPGLPIHILLSTHFIRCTQFRRLRERRARSMVQGDTILYLHLVPPHIIVH